MSRNYDLDAVQRLTAGAVGEPGDRTFFLQGRQDDTVVTLLVEKQQVAVLAREIEDFVARLPAPSTPSEEEVDPAGLDLEEPLEPDFRVGPMALGYDEDRDLVILQCEELVPESDEDEFDEPMVLPTEGATARFWATRAQMLALAQRGIAAVAAGRPVCPACGGAIEPGGHFCPPSNGHKHSDSFPETREL